MSKRGKAFFDRWTKQHLTPEAAKQALFPRPEHMLDALMLDADEKGISEQEIREGVGDLHTAATKALLAAPKAPSGEGEEDF